MKFSKTAFILPGILFLGLAVSAQSTNSGAGGSQDTTRRSFHRHGDHHDWAGGQDRKFRGGDHHDWAGGDRSFGERGERGRRDHIRYTPEQRKQVMAINSEYRQKSEELFNKDNTTLKEYKAGLIALQKEKKSRLEALLTPQQKDQVAARRKRMSENAQVMGAVRMERLRIRLNLSDDQVARIRSGEANLHAQVKAIHENDNLLPQQKREQMKDLVAKRKDVIKSVLTPEQQSKLEEMSRHRSGRGGFRGERGERGERGDRGDRGSIDDNQGK
jgi:Spy/CpxP family protein refolding chaperone